MATAWVLLCVCVFVLWDGCLISFSYGGYCFTIGLRKLYSLLQYFFFLFFTFYCCYYGYCCCWSLIAVIILDFIPSVIISIIKKTSISVLDVCLHITYIIFVVTVDYYNYCCRYDYYAVVADVLPLLSCLYVCFLSSLSSLYS